MLSLNMHVEYFNRLIGNLIITGIEIDMDRDADIIGKMDPYVVLDINGIKKKTSVKLNEGKKC